MIRKHKWLCWRCRSWRARFARGTCRICLREDLPVSPDGTCNLCDRQPVVTLGTTVEEANADGQQLYLANIAWAPTRTRDGVSENLDHPTDRNAAHAPAPCSSTRSSTYSWRCSTCPATCVPPRPTGAFPEPPHEQMAAYLDAAVLDHARRHGWPSSTTHRTRTGMRVLQTLQDTPGAMLLASDALLLHQIGLTAGAVIDVATAAGLMLDDRQPTIHDWFATTTADLPAPMRAELTEWFQVMLHGSTTPPRRRPRDHKTIRHYLRWAMPALTTWTTQGHQTLREITTADVRAILPASGNPRSTMGAGLRSILTLLKARKILFTNPIARVRTGGHERRDPLPAHAEQIRQALLSPDPARAALTALATFHGLRAGELRTMHLSDLADGRLHLDQRTILLAEPGPRPSLCMARPPQPPLAQHRQPPRVPQPPQCRPNHTRRRTLADPHHRDPDPHPARGPHPGRSARHRRRRPPHLRLVRAQRRRRAALPARAQHRRTR